MLPAEGLRASVRENATAYGFSVMITASFGVTNSLQPQADWWHNLLYAAGAAAGYALILILATKGGRETSTDAERSSVVIVASLLNFFSVVSGVATAALFAWVGNSWWPWAVSPLAATVVYLLVNGLEYSLAEEEEEEEG